METTTEKENTSLISVEEEISVKDEPMSPASSVSSRISEAGSSKKAKGIMITCCCIVTPTKSHSFI